MAANQWWNSAYLTNFLVGVDFLWQAENLWTKDFLKLGRKEPAWIRGLGLEITIQVSGCIYPEITEDSGGCPNLKPLFPTESYHWSIGDWISCMIGWQDRQKPPRRKHFFSTKVTAIPTTNIRSSSRSWNTMCSKSHNQFVILLFYRPDRWRLETLVKTSDKTEFFVDVSVWIVKIRVTNMVEECIKKT